MCFFSEDISAELPVIPGGDQPVEEEEGFPPFARVDGGNWFWSTEAITKWHTTLICEESHPIRTSYSNGKYWILLMEEIWQTTWDVKKPCKWWGQTTNLNWWSPDFFHWSINSMTAIQSNLTYSLTDDGCSPYETSNLWITPTMKLYDIYIYILYIYTVRFLFPTFFFRWVCHFSRLIVNKNHRHWEVRITFTKRPDDHPFSFLIYQPSTELNSWQCTVVIPCMLPCLVIWICLTMWS